MKTFRAIGVALISVLLSVSFSACGDDDEPSSGGNPLVGTWVEKVTDDSLRDYITFKADGTGFAGDWDKGDRYEDVESFRYKYTNTTVTLDWGDGSPKKYQYSISGKDLSLSRGGETTIYTKQ
jgi:hypothetical protein